MKIKKYGILTFFIHSLGKTKLPSTKYDFYKYVILGAMSSVLQIQVFIFWLTMSLSFRAYLRLLKNETNYETLLQEAFNDNRNNWTFFDRLIFIIPLFIISLSLTEFISKNVYVFSGVIWWLFTIFISPILTFFVILFTTFVILYLINILSHIKLDFQKRKTDKQINEIEYYE